MLTYNTIWSVNPMYMTNSVIICAVTQYYLLPEKLFRITHWWQYVGSLLLTSCSPANFPTPLIVYKNCHFLKIVTIKVFLLLAMSLKSFQRTLFSEQVKVSRFTNIEEKSWRSNNRLGLQFYEQLIETNIPELKMDIQWCLTLRA